MLKTTDTKIVCMNLQKTCNSLDGNKCKMVNGVCIFQHIQKSNSALDDTQRTETETNYNRLGNVTAMGEVRCYAT